MTLLSSLAATSKTVEKTRRVMHHITQVRKREGYTVAFIQERITNAILRALRETHEGGARESEKLSDRAVLALAEKFDGETPGVEDIQDIVVATLKKEGFLKTADAYTAYREKRAKIRREKYYLINKGIKVKLTPNALRVLESRYLRKDDRGKITETPSQLFERVARNIAQAERIYKPDITDEELFHFEETFYRMMASLEFLPNSPALMNAGAPLQQLAACFVLPVSDSIDGIFTSVLHQAKIHQSGGGTGFSFSRLRPKGDTVKSTHGVASGPISFMQIFDKATEVIKQGGKRRGANMGILRVDHPDILEFIDMKRKPGVMENFNVSVTVTDAFMDAYDKGEKYWLMNPRSGERVRELDARFVFDKIVRAAWETADPGLIFVDRINDGRGNPTPKLGQIEATNPCFAGSERLATDHGLLTFKELYLDQLSLAVSTDNRVLAIREAAQGAGGGTAVATKTLVQQGITVRPAVPVFKTRKNWPVYELETEHGFRVVATEDHKFFTPEGLKELKDFVPGDEVLIQSGSGVWSNDTALPPFVPEDKLRARIARGECQLPRTWSRELGHVLGWVVGDGFINTEKPKGRNIPNYTVGLLFGDEEKKILKPRFKKMIREWLGLEGADLEYNGVSSLRYKSALYYFLRSLGVEHRHGAEKRVPASLWSAPREAVIGFLQALFTADGTVNISQKINYGSIRLASSAKRLLEEVQLLLLNEGIVSQLYHRRKAGEKLMPDSNRQPKPYHFKDQYELVITRENRRRFLSQIGFLLSRKQKKAEEFERTLTKGAYREKFVTRVKSISYTGKEDVFCTTEQETRSLIVNGFVARNCGEVPLLPYESCILGSIVLSRHAKEEAGRAVIDWHKLKTTVHNAMRFLDNLIDMSRYPVEEIEAMTHGNRRTGLGIMGFADLLVDLQVPFGSEESYKLGERIMAFIDREATKASAALAQERGVFPNFRDSVYDRPGMPRVRNCARTSIAPTGTIGIIAGCSQGIEPIFALAYIRYSHIAKEADEWAELVEVNPVFEEIARREGFYSKKLMEKVAQEGTVQSMREVPVKWRKVFVTAHDLTPEQHIKIQAVFQKHVDNACSKTINMPATATVEDVKKAYLLAWKTGCKGITIYRDQSKAQQVLNIKGHIKKEAKQEGEIVNVRKLRPDLRDSGPEIPPNGT